MRRFHRSIFFFPNKCEAIAGDLIEEFQRRQPAPWVWVQVPRSLGHLSWLGMGRAPGGTVAAMLAEYIAMACAAMAAFGIWETAGGSNSMQAFLGFELLGGFFRAALGGYIAARITRGRGANGMIGLCGFTSLMALWKEPALMSAFPPGMLPGGFPQKRQMAKGRN